MRDASPKKSFDHENVHVQRRDGFKIEGRANRAADGVAINDAVGLHLVDGGDDVKLAEWKSAKRVVAIAVAGKSDSAASMLASQPQTSPALVAQPVAVTTSAAGARAA